MANNQPTGARAPREALLIVDVQNDFCAGGALAVPGADRVIEAVNGCIDDAVARGLPVYASRDWHLPEAKHFKPDGEWPVHCVQGTRGARFHDALHLPVTAIVISKGEDADRPGYSAFEGHTPDGTPLLDDLRRRGIDRLYVTGLATDYCVKHSVVDARGAGLDVIVLGAAIAGVDLAAGDSERALAEMEEHGATITRDPHPFRRSTGEDP